MSKVLVGTNRKALNRKSPLLGTKLVGKFTLSRPKQDTKTFQMLIQGKGRLSGLSAAAQGGDDD